MRSAHDEERRTRLAFGASSPPPASINQTSAPSADANVIESGVFQTTREAARFAISRAGNSIPGGDPTTRDPPGGPGAFSLSYEVSMDVRVFRWTCALAVALLLSSGAAMAHTTSAVFGVVRDPS